MIDANTIIGGRYRVTKPLGGGGMKMVYLAEDLRLAARPCALAEMVDTFTSPDMQRQAVTAFQREADMLAQLSNEHIPRVFDRFSEQNRHYLVMEFIDGITLEQKLRDSGGKLPETEVIGIAVQVCDTLQYLHNLVPPVIYRDLKPSNVMLASYNQVKLIDFGIARLFRPQSNATMIGTQGYAPPEQYRGKAEFRSDLYALGATMHHALSGRDPAAEPPFSFPPLRSVCPNVTPALAELVDQALQYDTIMRVADAAEFKTRLMAIKSGSARVITGAKVPPRPPAGRRAQLGLPLGVNRPWPNSADASDSSAPTVLVTSTDQMACPRCGRLIPSDSRFCSFCAAQITVILGGEQEVHEARTVNLDDLSRESIPPGRILRRLRAWRNPAFYYVVLASLFAAAFALTSFIVREMVDRSDTPAEVPSESGGFESARLAQLRQELDDDGYKGVSFKLVGDTLIVWGNVATDFDRANIRWLAFRVAGIVSIQDNIHVQNAYAEP